VLARLVTNFAASFPDKPTMKARLADWLDMLMAYPWITDDVLYKAVPTIRFMHRGPFVPELAVFLDHCRLALKDIQLAEQRALPPPAPVPDGWAAKSGPERARFLERHVALGVLRARAGVSLTSFDGELIPFDPPEADVAAAVAELRAKRFLQGALERIAAGEVVTPVELIAAQAARKGGRPVTDGEARAAYARRGKRWPGAEE
jgi:hypothetical protein